MGMHWHTFRHSAERQGGRRGGGKEPDACYTPLPLCRTTRRSSWPPCKRMGTPVHASAALWNDKEVVMAAVQKNGWARYTLAACKRQGGRGRRTTEWVCTETCPAALKNDKEFVMSAVQQNGYALKHASAALKNDKEFVVRRATEWYALVHASATLKNDKGVMAVQKNGRALYTPCHLQNMGRLSWPPCNKWYALEHLCCAEERQGVCHVRRATELVCTATRLDSEE